MGLKVFLARYDTYIILETSGNSTFKELKLGFLVLEEPDSAEELKMIFKTLSFSVARYTGKFWRRFHTLPPMYF